MDLRRAFYGGADSSEQAALQAAYDAGVSMADLVDLVGHTADGFLPYTFDPNGASTNAGFGAANRAHYTRVSFGGTITKIGLEVTTQSGNLSVAVCRGTAGKNSTMTRIATSGAVACPAVGYAEISLGGSVEVLPGDWFAISADNTVSRFKAVPSASGLTSLSLGFTTFGDTHHPIPTGGGTGGGGAPGPGIVLIGVP